MFFDNFVYDDNDITRRIKLNKELNSWLKDFGCNMFELNPLNAISTSQNDVKLLDQPKFVAGSITENIKYAYNWIITDDKQILTIPAPGLNKTDFAISISDDNALTVDTLFKDNKTLITRPFKYTFKLQTNVMIDDVVATYDAGVLTVIIPKGTSKQSRMISIT